MNHLFGDLFGNFSIDIIDNNLVINGDLQVNGNINNSGEITSTDAIIVLNDGEAGAGVTSGFAGVDIDRGSSTNYRFGFDETDDSFKLGEIGSLQKVATRGTNLTAGKVPYGNTDNSYTEDSLFHYDGSNDRLGIGLASPLQRLHLADAGANAVYARIGNSVAATGLDMGIDGTGAASVAAQNSVQITSSGNIVITGNGSDRVGIRGAINGSYDIYSNGTHGFSSSINVTGQATVANLVASSTSANTFTRTGAEDTNAIASWSNGTGEVARITKSGLLGVGTTPVNLGHFHESTSGASNISITNLTTGDTSGDGLLVGLQADETAQIWMQENQALVLGANNTEWVRLTASGDLGVGNTPATKLDVQGAVRVAASGTPASGAGLELTYSDPNSTIRSYDRTGAAYKSLIIDSLGTTQQVSGATKGAWDSTGLSMSSTIRRSVTNSFLGLYGDSSGGSSSSRILLYGTAEATNPNEVQIYGNELFINNIAGTNRLEMDSSGNFGIGKSPSYLMDINGIMNCTAVYENGLPFVQTTLWDQNTGSDLSTPAATWDDWIGVGVTDPDCRIHVHEDAVSGTNHLMHRLETASGGVLDWECSDLASATPTWLLTSGASESIAFGVGGTEAARFTSGQDFLVGKSASDSATVGCELGADGVVRGTADGTFSAIFNRETSDGEVILVRQDNTTIGQLSTLVDQFILSAPRASGTIAFLTGSGGTEAARFDSSQRFMVSKSSFNFTSGGFQTSGGETALTRAEGQVLLLNRKSTPGVLSTFYYNDVAVGGISVDTGEVELEGGTLKFKAGGLEAARFDSSQRFGIGTTSPSYELHVQKATTSTTASRIAITSGTAASATLYLGDTADNEIAYLTYANQNGQMVLRNNNGNAVIIDASQNILSGSDNTKTLGGASNRWSEVFAGNGTINTSDEREKTQLAIDQKVLDAINSISVKAFKWNDAIEAKGDVARVHYGVIAQEVKAAFEAQGLVAEDYGVLCYDEWDDQYVTQIVEKSKPAVLDEDGNELEPKVDEVWEDVLVQPAGNRYGVRYDELYAMKIAALEARITALESA
jgi:hypothetical protein